MIKEDLFKISGQCQHSGNCCRSIMIFDQSVPIDDIDDWDQFVSKNQQYHRFKPEIENTKIQSYSCSCLTESNRCSDYFNRPNLCSQYPYSFFYEHGYIHSTCGYSVSLDINRFRYVLPVIKNHVKMFYRMKV